MYSAKQISADATGRATNVHGARERILLASAALFRAKGYSGTTVRDIANEVGILSGSLFHHFRSKEEILAEMLREAALSMCVGSEVLLQQVAGDDPVHKLRILVRFELNCFAGSKMKDYYAVLVTEWREVSSSLKAELRAMRQRYRGIVMEVLQACEDAKLLRSPLPASELVLHGITTSTTSWFRDSGLYSVEEYADIVCHLLLADAVSPNVRR